MLCEAQAVALFNALAGNRVQTAVLLAIATGMRRGEILALRWSDIDLDSPRAVVSVTRSLEGIGRDLRFKETKSRSGVRQIPLPQFWIETLRRHKAKQNAIRLAKGALTSTTILSVAATTARRGAREISPRHSWMH